MGAELERWKKDHMHTGPKLALKCEIQFFHAVSSLTIEFTRAAHR